MSYWVNPFSGFIEKLLAGPAGAAGTSFAPTVSGTFSAPNLISNGGTIAVPGGYVQIVYIAGNGGPVTAAGIAAGTNDGELLELVFCDDTNTVTIGNSSSVSINGALTGKQYWSQYFRWTASVLKWRDTNGGVERV